MTEPEPGITKLDWMQDSLDLLHSHDIKVVLCTPTATPPKWLVDSMPDMLATDRNGQLRTFGSRRHYSFAHMGYRREAARMIMRHKGGYKGCGASVRSIHAHPDGNHIVAVG